MFFCARVLRFVYFTKLFGLEMDPKIPNINIVGVWDQRPKNITYSEIVPKPRICLNKNLSSIWTFKQEVVGLI